MMPHRFLHGNLSALEAVLSEIDREGVDVYSLVVFFFLLPERPCLQKVLEYPNTVTQNLYTFTGT